VDSSVGGKTAIDTLEGKNLIGLFNQPRLVIADLDVLSTLPTRELRAGYAEIVKIGLIEDAAFFAWCEANARALIGGGAAARAYAIRVAVAAKAAIVAADEREQGRRALLNLGHTFGHALEAHGDYGAALLHGEAVAAGMALAFQFAAQQGVCPPADAARVTAHLEAVGFVTDLRKLAGAPFDPARLAQLMAADKKNEAGALTLILPRGIGQAFVQKHADAAAVAQFLTQAVQ
jgi:3-dehydroquinate synthase